MLIELVSKNELQQCISTQKIEFLNSIEWFANGFLQDILQLDFEISFQIFHERDRSWAFVEDSKDSNIIYLKKSFIEEHGNPEIASVFFHELGHLIDFNLKRKEEFFSRRKSTIKVLKDYLEPYKDIFSKSYFDYLADEHELIARMFEAFFIDLLTPFNSPLRNKGRGVHGVMPPIKGVSKSYALFHPYSTRICLRFLGRLKDERIRNLLLS